MSKTYLQDFRNDFARVAQSREDGVTLEQIAADFGIHPMTLSKWVRNADGEPGSNAARPPMSHGNCAKLNCGSDCRSKGMRSCATLLRTWPRRICWKTW